MLTCLALVRKPPESVFGLTGTTTRVVLRVSTVVIQMVKVVVRKVCAAGVLDIEGVCAVCVDLRDCVIVMTVVLGAYLII